MTLLLEWKNHQFPARRLEKAKMAEARPYKPPRLPQPDDPQTSKSPDPKDPDDS